MIIIIPFIRLLAYFRKRARTTSWLVGHGHGSGWLSCIAMLCGWDDSQIKCMWPWASGSGCVRNKRWDMGIIFMFGYHSICVGCRCRCRAVSDWVCAHRFGDTKYHAGRFRWTPQPYGRSVIMARNEMCMLLFFWYFILTNCWNAMQSNISICGKACWVWVLCLRLVCVFFFHGKFVVWLWFDLIFVRF